MCFRRRLSACMIILGLCCLLFAAGCDDSNEPGPVGSGALPEPTPANGATQVPRMVTLSWPSIDMPSHTIFYDLHLSTSRILPLVDSRITDTLYTVGPLLPNTVYYWSVFAHDAQGNSKASALWSFRTDSNLVFPLTVGNWWQYSSESYRTNLVPDSVADLCLQDTIFQESTTELERRDTLFDALPVYVFRTDWGEGDVAGSVEGYRYWTEDGLYLYPMGATTWPGPLKVGCGGGTYLEFQGMKFSSIGELDRYFHNVAQSPPPTVTAEPADEFDGQLELAYPLVVGERWTYSDDPWTIEKEVVGRARVTVPAGTFDCLKIKWFWDVDGDGVWDDNVEGYDYVSTAGFVERRYHYYGLKCIGYDSYTELGTFDVVSTYRLTDFHLAE